jgi:hypothetical protein
VAIVIEVLAEEIEPLPRCLKVHGAAANPITESETVELSRSGDDVLVASADDRPLAVYIDQVSPVLAVDAPLPECQHLFDQRGAEVHYIRRGCNCHGYFLVSPYLPIPSRRQG